MSRLSTGVTQCGDDWPGVFIRGDEAMHYAEELADVVAAEPSGDGLMLVLRREALLRLAALLGSADVRATPRAAVQRVELVMGPSE